MASWVVDAPEPIAVVGIGCRLPGGLDTPSRLWSELRSPRNLARRIPKERWSIDKYYHPVATHHGTTNVTESYFLDDDLSRFDAQFFSIGASEAEAMDPQHRLLLEVVYEAMESGGYTLSQLQGSDTAVYVGMMCTDYYATELLDANQIPRYAATGIATSNASSRVSYHLDWHGPSMTIDTACSSSLVALHHAVDQLRLRRSRVAVASGTNLLLTPVSYISESNLFMLSPTGRSRMWDAAADGYARGDGIAAVLLKRLSDAIADGDEIRGVIRHTGFSHDGKTHGITMPSGAAQADLIRRTYAEAGLDVTRAEDRPQFFEAHGTGTPVGDPQEASALATAFFPDQRGPAEQTGDMFVGSIKTVVGHTEGTAGIAGIIKACLALENAQIPPNLLLEQLSPAVAPYARNLRILTGEAAPWPSVPKGQPRRASVNSFGFGGTDAHAILESYNPPPSSATAAACASAAAAAVLPFTFSAASESSLTALLEEYHSFLSGPQGESVSLGDLGYTLTCRRSALNYKISFAATTVEGLCDSIASTLESSPSIPVSRTTQESCTAYLGVFTGQGAQWARMGYELVQNSPVASGIIDRLEATLSNLPSPGDRPTWSLREELAAGKDVSRVAEADISQPLCTAVQIVLVDLLRLAGIRFAAVVGHSSGEIAAAYAAGFISAEDAFLIAYYRGRCTTAPSGGGPHTSSSGEQGSMLAVGTTVEDAQDLCNAEDMLGRISLAAVNSPSSVTLSGDQGAVLEAKEVFDAENKFCRVLRVDKAYHSHHMLPCAAAYRDALNKLAIKVRRPGDGAAAWFSSSLSTVDSETAAPVVTHQDTAEALACDYWVRNMTNTVLFQQALAAAVDSRPLDVAIEVGPHPALKGPATEVIQAQAAGATPMPYFGTCQRGKHDVVSLAETLGGLWALRGPAPLRLRDYQSAFTGRPPRLITNLPKYTWDHRKGYWTEPRTTRNVNREEGVSFHDLLGQKLPDANDREWRWLNVLSEEELPWLAGHALQGQTVFPTTGYIAMALEASLLVAAAGGKSARGETNQSQSQPKVRAIELRDVDIRKALAIPTSGSEVVVSLTAVTRGSSRDGDNTITAYFCCSAPPTKESEEVAINCTAQVLITLGDRSTDVLPPRQQLLWDEEGKRKGDDEHHDGVSSGGGLLQEVDVDEFYDNISSLGFGYTGAFRAVTRLRRRLGRASGTVANRAPFDPKTSRTRLLMHPAVLDSALQGVFAAYSHPGDDRLWSLHAPTHVDRIVVVPGLCGADAEAEPKTEGEGYDVDWFCTDDSQRNRIVSDVDVYSPGYSHKVVSIEGLSLVPLSPFTQLDDRYMFSSADWYIDGPDGEVAAEGYEPDRDDVAKAYDVERIIFYFLRGIGDTLHEADNRLKARPGTEAGKGQSLAPHRRAAMRWVDHLQDLVSRGEHPALRKEWLSDDKATIYALIEKYAAKNDADVNMARVIGESLPRLIREELDEDDENGGNIIGHMVADGALDRLYEEGLGQKETNAWSSRMVQQVAERYPQMDIIEIGAGTGGTTKGIVASLGKAFASYTVTDVSSGFFPAARAVFEARYGGRMAYQVLDITQSPAAQGFRAGSYDMAVAANVLHATPDLKETLRNVRSLLKAGGYLVMVEITDHTAIRYGGYYCGTPGWWVGAEDGRPWGPAITIPEWDRLLRESGFAGVHTSAPIKNPLVTAATVFMAQAMDDDFRLLAAPLDPPHPLPLPLPGRQNLALVASGGRNATRLAQEVQELVKGYYDGVWVFETLEHVSTVENLPPNCTTVGLTDLDDEPGPLFRTLTAPGWEGLKRLQAGSSSVLWLTRGATDGSRPFSSMAFGWLRSVQYEHSQSQFQALDLPDDDDHLNSPNAARLVAETALRLSVQGHWRASGAKKEMLWTLEQQLAWDSRHTKILRVKPDLDKNDRYNSAHRRILKGPKPQARVSLRWDPSPGRSCWIVGSENVPQGKTQEQYQGSEKDLLVLAADTSVLPAIRLPGSSSRMFLVLGQEQATSQRYLCLTGSQASTHLVPPSHAIPVARDTTISLPYLSYAFAYLMSELLLDLASSHPDSILVVNEPDSTVASLFLGKIKRGRPVKVIFTTCNPVHGAKRDWTLLHPHDPQRVIASKLRLPLPLPNHSDNRMVFVDFSLTPDGRKLASRIDALLPPSWPRLDANDFFSAEPLDLGASRLLPAEKLREVLTGADDLAMALLYETTESTPLPMSTLDQLTTSTTRQGDSAAKQMPDLRLVSWPEATTSTPVEVTPADQRNDLFQPDVTYWLIGLAGDLGRSLCDWMTAHGARHVVFSSRNPQIPAPWLAAHEDQGHHIAAIKLDVTSLAAVQRAKAEIEEKLQFPPIKGVANGAMVLRDKPMMDTDYATLQEILRPKVEGTLNLDAVFSSTSDELDWFIVLTSFIADIGNFGQMGYSTANMFQKALVRQRRNRGLAGSSIDLASVVGVGYVTREKAGGQLDRHQAERILKRSRVRVISEADLRHAFAEAVLSGRPASGLDPEIITGPQPVTKEQSQDTITAWARIPTFSHWIRDEHGADKAAAAQDAGGKRSVRAMLAEAESQEEVFSIIRDALLSRLMISLSSDSINDAIPLIELGVDSLVAVLLRDWAQGELGVNLPVLKVLGGDSTLDLVQHIVENLDLGLDLGPGADESEDSRGDGDQSTGEESSSLPSDVSVSSAEESLGTKE